MSQMSIEDEVLLWSPLKKDGYIGIIGYVDSVK